MNEATLTPPPSPKERAITLLAEISVTRAALKEALSPYETQIAELNATLSKARAPHDEKLEQLKLEAEALGLSEVKAVFGPNHSTLVSNGLQLKLSETDAVKCDEMETTIKRLRKEMADANANEADRMAAEACLRINIELNKAYVQSMYENHTEWFNLRGIFMEDRVSVKLGDAPKQRTPKPKAVKKPKAKKDAAKDETLQEAA